MIGRPSIRNTPKSFRNKEYYQRTKMIKQEMLSKIEKYNEIKAKVGKYVDLQINNSKPGIPPEVILNIFIPITNYILTLLLFTV